MTLKKLSFFCALGAMLFLTACSGGPSMTGSLTTPTAEGQGKMESSREAGEGLAPGFTPYTQAPEGQEESGEAPKTKVAFLAPLSGKSEALGQAMVNAAQLAVFDVGGQEFELMPRDTKGTPEGARKAVQDALASGANLVIGPVFAANVVAVKPELKATEINALALSTDISLAEPGVYVMGFAPTPQVRRVVSYALSQGLTRFALLRPPGPYGELVTKAFTEAVREGQGRIVFSGDLSSLGQMAEKKEQIQAIFLPFGGAMLRQISTRLVGSGFVPGQVRILGTGLWDEPDLARDQKLLIGGWYAASDVKTRQPFLSAYTHTFGSEPPRLATLAYDATALAAVLVRRQMLLTRMNLTNPSGFAGLDGIFRLLANGQIERGLAINEITETGPKIVDASPQSFATGR